MPNLTLTCPTKKLPFDLGVAIMPGVALTTQPTPIQCSQCGQTHTFAIAESVPALVPEPPPQNPA